MLRFLIGLAALTVALNGMFRLARTYGAWRRRARARRAIAPFAGLDRIRKRPLMARIRDPFAILRQ